MVSKQKNIAFLAVIITLTILGIILYFLYFLNHNKEKNELNNCRAIITNINNLFPESVKLYQEKIKSLIAKSDKEYLKVCKEVIKELDQKPPGKILELPVKQGSPIISETNFPYLLNDGKVLFKSSEDISFFDFNTQTFKVIYKLPEYINYEFYKLPNNHYYIGGYNYDPVKQIFYLDKQINKKLEEINKKLSQEEYVVDNFPDLTKLIASGCNVSDGFHNNCKAVYLIDLINNKTFPKTQLQIPRGHFQAIKIKDGNILIIGGQNFNENKEDGVLFNDIELYNPILGTTKVIGKTKLPFGLSSNAIILKNGKVLLIDNIESTAYSPSEISLEIYDPETKKIKLIEDIRGIAYGRFQKAVLMPETGFVLLIFSNALLIDPDKGLITILNNPRFRYFEQNYTPLSNNKILITGGINPLDEERKIQSPAILEFQYSK